MMVLLAPAWSLVSWAFNRSKLAARVARDVESAPPEEMSPELLFGCLLSANFAVMMNDNFKQLGSALPKQRVKKLLAEQWGIETRADCIRVIDQAMVRLGEISPAEMKAVAVWLGEQRSEGDVARLDRLASIDDLSHGRLSVLAWDIQQLAYLIRLALAAGHVSRNHAEDVLERLTIRARRHYGSWPIYSMAALVGLGMRSSMEIFETSAWERYSRTHSAFLGGPHSPIKFASPWGEAHKAAPHLAGALRRAIAATV
ncbi:MAG: DUF1266 domain-containing protein [Variovorax sp.]|nr:DUF1266 domain-containing protein [Variovorax sp.]